MHHHALLIFVFLVETGFHHVGQAGLELLTSGLALSPSLECSVFVEVGFCHVTQADLKLLGFNDPPALASKVPGLQHFGRLRQEKCLKPEVRDQPRQHSEITSLRKIKHKFKKKLPRSGLGTVSGTEDTAVNESGSSCSQWAHILGQEEGEILLHVVTRENASLQLVFVREFETSLANMAKPCLCQN
ncbi:hypothetical protein AAY473_003801 [Plecturocebus cupreus]